MLYRGLRLRSGCYIGFDLVFIYNKDGDAQAPILGDQLAIKQKNIILIQIFLVFFLFLWKLPGILELSNPNIEELPFAHSWKSISKVMCFPFDILFPRIEPSLKTCLGVYIA